MATKKEKDAAYDAFLADLKAIAPQIEEILADDRVSTKLREGVLARQDYSTKMDAMSAERTQFEQEVTEARKRIEGWKNWYGTESAKFAQTADELTRYKDEFGDLTGTQKRQVATQHGLTVEDFEKRLNEEIQKRDVAALKFVDELTDLKIEHRQRFGEKLDTEAVYKIAGEKQLPLDIAYQVFTTDKVEAERKTKYDDELKKAREEGFREALSKHNLPVMSSGNEVIHVLDIKDASRNSDDRVNAAVTAFMNRK